MTTESLDDLLKRMPEIAAAVNAFESDVVQQQAFVLLTGGMMSEDSAANSGKPRPQKGGTGSQTTQNNTKDAKNGKKSKSRNTSQVATPKIVSNLNLRPDSKESLKDFVDAKRPLSNQEYYSVIVHYLQNVAEVQNIAQDHIYTAFKNIGVAVPKNIPEGLRGTMRNKGWVSTDDRTNWSMTVNGENFVEHELPKSE